MHSTVATIAFALSSFVVGTSILMKRDVTLTASTDNGTAQVVIPSANVTSIVVPQEADIGGTADAAGAVANVVNQVYQYIQGLVNNDIQKRMLFTQQTVAQVRQATGKNVVMSNVDYTFSGTPITKSSIKYKAKIGADVSYDVLTFNNGTFSLHGDGGFQNWAFILDKTCAQSAALKTFSC